MPTPRYRTEPIKRLITFLVGISIMSLGIAFTIVSDLGTSPVSSLPYVASLIFPFGVGPATIILHTLLIGVQMLILRSRFDRRQLAQLPAAVVFGFLIDFWVFALSSFAPTSYLTQWVATLIGITLMGIGISFQVLSETIVLAVEGVVLALKNELIRLFGPKPAFQFGTLKTGFDFTLVILSVVLSLAFLGSVAGVREGTIAGAFFVGIVSKFAHAALKSPIRRWHAKGHPRLERRLEGWERREKYERLKLERARRNRKRERTAASSQLSPKES